MSILDGDMENTIRFAAERGVDVRIVLPGIPDKKAPYMLAKTHYQSLLEASRCVVENHRAPHVGSFP
jgi:cardiolipin synthase